MRVINNFENVFRFFKNKTGRRELIVRLQHRFWPFSGWLAFFYRRTIIRKVKIVVVIGSLGKTTTTKAIKIALGLTYADKVISNQYGAQAFSILMINPFSHIKVFEVAIAKPGDMEKIGNIIQPDIVVFTSVATDHLVNFGTIENIRDDKAKMIRFIKKGGVLFANGDDEHVMLIAKQSGIKYFNYGMKPDNQIRCNSYSIDLQKGLKTEIVLEGKTFNPIFNLFNHKMIYPYVFHVVHVVFA